MTVKPLAQALQSSVDKQTTSYQEILRVFLVGVTQHLESASKRAHRGVNRPVSQNSSTFAGEILNVQDLSQLSAWHLQAHNSHHLCAPNITQHKPKLYHTFASCRTLLFHFHLSFPSFVRLIDVFLMLLKTLFSVLNTLSLFKL
jgi:hypothetical protein